MKTFVMHETAQIEIKPGIFADIDKNIIWLVNWLNKFEGIETTSSCEAMGNPPAAFVLFRMDDISMINHILDIVEKYNISEIDKYRDTKSTQIGHLFFKERRNGEPYHMGLQFSKGFDRFKKWIEDEI